MTDKTRVDLTGAPQTMLATLYAKALDAGAADPALHDHLAADIVAQIDYDWAKTGITPGNAPSVALRSSTSTPGRGSSSRCIPKRWWCTSAAGWTAASSGWRPGRGSSGTTSTTPT